MTDLPTTSPAFDLIIRGGTVIDGTRAPRFQADVGITDGRIAVIGPLDNRTAAREIDATGRIVAPGSQFGPRITVERNLPPGRYRLLQSLHSQPLE